MISEVSNPFIPGYIADSNMIFDEVTKMFYLYGTNDGNHYENVWPPQVWCSKDFTNWENHNVYLPEEWFKTFAKTHIWAPSIIQHPITKKFYIVFSIHHQTFIAYSNSPLGPFEDANYLSPGSPLLISGNQWNNGGDAYDSEFFVDDDNSVYLTFGGWRKCGILKLKFEDNFKVSVDNSDERMTDSNFAGDDEIKYKLLTPVESYLEASCMIKRNSLYYLMFSSDSCENYNVRYVVSESPLGPFKELNDSLKKPILSRNDDLNILGTGHHCVLKHEGNYYIVYHRQHYPFIDSKRQQCIDKMEFNEDGSIKTIIPTHRGIAPFQSEDIKQNLCLGKEVRTSSVRKYIPTNTSNIEYTFDGSKAVDGNYATRFDAGIGINAAWLIVDLGEDYKFTHCETIFEFTNKTYKYKIEYLSSQEAETIDNATSAKEWKMFCDKTEVGEKKSPIIDIGDASGRYLKLSIVGMEGVPERSEPKDTNAINAISVVNFRAW